MKIKTKYNSAALARCRWAIAAWQRKKSITTFRCLMRDNFIHYTNELYDCLWTPYRIVKILVGTVGGKYADINAKYHYTNCKWNHN